MDRVSVWIPVVMKEETGRKTESSIQCEDTPDGLRERLDKRGSREK